mgnify:FL=1
MGREATDHDLRHDLRRAGLRATAPRVAVLSLLRGSAMPLSHPEVNDLLGGRGWDRATLYRNLVDLTRRGLARRVDLGDRIWRFEDARAEHGATEHPHFVCTECGEIVCLHGVAVSWRATADAPRALRHGEVEVQVRGRCDGCGRDAP